MNFQNKIITIANNKLFIGAGVFIYAIIFIPLFNIIGGPVASFGFLLTVTAGWCCRWQGAIGVGVVISIINSFGYRYVAQSTIITDIVSFLVLSGLGVLASKIKDYSKRYKDQTVELYRDKAALKSEIQQRQEAEIEIQRINETLVEMNQKLRQTQAQLIHSSKMASLGVLASNIAHELNQPLGTIYLNTEMILQDVKSNRTDELEKLSHGIIDQVNRSRVIIDHLKIFGRDSDLQQDELIDINNIISDSFILMNSRIRTNEIEVIKELNQEPLMIYGNSVRVEQVLTNLISNAIDALVDCPIPQIIIRSRLNEVGDSAIVEVEDNGSGIPDDELVNVFDPFFTTKEVGKGTGLGLSICYGIIQEHGGDITVESEPGQKTKFCFYIPLKKTLEKGK